MAASASSDLFSALQAIWTADAAKLGSGELKVLAFERVGVDRFGIATPFILVEIDGNPDNTFTQDQVVIRGALHLYTEIDRPITEQDTIAERIRVKFDQAALAGTDWAWSDTQLDVPRQERQDGRRRHASIPFVTMGSRSGVSAKPKRLFARAASISFTAGAGGETINADSVRVFIDEEGSELVDWTVRGSDYKKRVGGRFDASLQLILDADDFKPATSTIPLQVVGTLTILANKGDDSHGKITGPFIFESRKRSAPAYRLDGRQELTYLGYFTEDTTQNPSHMTETP